MLLSDQFWASWYNFREALGVFHKVGKLAETEGHHPDISFGRGYATVSLSTKRIKGLQRERLQHGEQD